MQNILSIVGPTATGKTSLALWLAERLIVDQKISGVDLISADSRQVYRELPVISGADIPDDLPKGIAVHGVGIIGVDDDWSVAHFRNFALPIIEQSLARDRLPLVVGGTGLYHRHLFNPELAEQPGPDFQLRQELEGQSVAELQARLSQLSPERLASMNDSDRHNPRRLVRAIEHVSQPVRPITDGHLPADDEKRLTIGLTDTLEQIEQKIVHRVAERWQQGALEEVERLLVADLERPALSATGVKEIRQYLEGQLTEGQAQAAWALREFQYAKRQLTWWKKEKGVSWYHLDQPDWREKMYAAILSL